MNNEPTLATKAAKAQPFEIKSNGVSIYSTNNLMPMKHHVASLFAFILMVCAYPELAVACSVQNPPPGYPYYFRGQATRQDAIDDAIKNGRGRPYVVCQNDVAGDNNQYLIFFARP